mmetsp:Transcript_30951/g.98786  ORF Transcript_30951/g.98786 Transcript_30951/m.98786 type:complete len:369 (+) Transcript_30951:899-2005(+)
MATYSLVRRRNPCGGPLTSSATTDGPATGSPTEPTPVDTVLLGSAALFGTEAASATLATSTISCSAFWACFFSRRSSRRAFADGLRSERFSRMAAKKTTSIHDMGQETPAMLLDAREDLFAAFTGRREHGWQDPALTFLQLLGNALIALVAWPLVRVLNNPLIQTVRRIQPLEVRRRHQHYCTAMTLQRSGDNRLVFCRIQTASAVHYPATDLQQVQATIQNTELPYVERQTVTESPRLPDVRRLSHGSVPRARDIGQYPVEAQWAGFAAGLFVPQLRKKLRIHVHHDGTRRAQTGHLVCQHVGPLPLQLIRQHHAFGSSRGLPVLWPMHDLQHLRSLGTRSSAKIKNHVVRLHSEEQRRNHAHHLLS